MSASLYIAIILVIAIIAYMIVQQILNKRAVKELDQNEFHNGIRKDQPVYLCDANGIASYRAARILKKNGYTDIYMLKGGYKKWTGKIKSKK